MHNLKKTFISGVVGVGVSLGLLVIGVQAQSGSLEPPGSAVNGSGDPVPTTQMQPSWDQDLPVNERFKLVLGGEGVLDKETGLVWEQSPLTTPHTWRNAKRNCINRTVGGKQGWRLPSVHELASLVDPTRPINLNDPILPADHPFGTVLDDYWSATKSADSPSGAWSVDFLGGFVFTAGTASEFHIAWCVRGGGPLADY